LLWDKPRRRRARGALFDAAAFDPDRRDRLILINAKARAQTRARGASSCKTVKATRTSRQIVKYFLADPRPLKSRKAEEAVADRIRIIKHEAVPKCGSYEVRFPDDRPTHAAAVLNLPPVIRLVLVVEVSDSRDVRRMAVNPGPMRRGLLGSE
jgi:hypothetical protein